MFVPLLLTLRYYNSWIEASDAWLADTSTEGVTSSPSTPRKMTKKEAEVKTLPKAKPTDESVLGVNSFAMPDVAMSGAVDDSWCESESQVK